MAKYCANCGSKLADDDLFCGVCGTKQESLKEAVMPVSLPEEKSAVQITIATPAMTVEEAKEPEKRKKKAWIIILCILLALCAAAVAFFFFGGAELFSRPKGLIAADEIEEKLNEVFAQGFEGVLEFEEIEDFVIEDVEEETHDQRFQGTVANDLYVLGKIKKGRVVQIQTTWLIPTERYDQLDANERLITCSTLAIPVSIYQPELDSVLKIMDFLGEKEIPSDGEEYRGFAGNYGDITTVFLPRHFEEDGKTGVSFVIRYLPAFPDDSDEDTTGTMEQADSSSQKEVPSDKVQSASIHNEKSGTSDVKGDFSKSELKQSEEADYEKEEIEISHIHNYSEWIGENGTTHKRICECGDQEIEGHIFDSGRITKEPTEVEHGYKVLTCIRCNITKNEMVAKKKHVHAFGEWENTNSVSHMRKCSCGESEIAEHSFDIGTITKEPTETETGIKTYVCTVCGATKTETIDVLQHTHRFSDWADDGNSSTHSRKCSCGEEQSQMHNWNLWMPTSEDADGFYEESSCLICTATQTRYHAHNYEYQADEEFYKWLCAGCGRASMFNPG